MGIALENQAGGPVARIWEAPRKGYEALKHAIIE